jgi:hypothetical protein
MSSDEVSPISPLLRQEVLQKPPERDFFFRLNLA